MVSICMHGRSRMAIYGIYPCIPTMPGRRMSGFHRRGGMLKGGGGYSFVACLSRLTLDHASLSRRGTVPTTIIEAPLTFGGAHYACSIYST